MHVHEMGQDAAVGEIRQQIALASRILTQHEIVDSFGHVSARHPARSDRFLLSRRLAPGLVTDADVVEFDLDGELSGGDQVPVFLERYIHSAIYAARPDVAAIVHSHSPAIVTIGIVKNHPLRAVCHMCGFLGDGVPNFEIRDVAGDATDLLIRNAELGGALARALGNANVVLMRGHGSTIVAGSVQQAVYRAIYSELNARIQAAATALGPITFLTAAEAKAGDAVSDVQIERTWRSWVESLDG